MIAGCLPCATRHTAPARPADSDSWLNRCPACGSSWLEANAIEIAEARFETPLAIDQRHDLDAEARRLAEAARLAAERHQARRRTRRQALRGWAILILAVAVPLAGAIAYPESVTRAAPPAARLYSLAGLEVNASGFEIRDATSQLEIVSGTRLLTVSGEIVNLTDRPREVPSLGFVLRDVLETEIYAWTLNGAGTRKIAPGQASSFLTRVAAPPLRAREVEIRFARGE